MNPPHLSKVSMTDVYVAFKKNWQRDYNRDEMGLSGRVTDKDVETIKNRVAGEFDRVLRSWPDTLRKHLDSVKVVAAETDR